MASSLIINTIQVYFDSVLEMDNEGVVAMFEALISSGLSGFLGCSSAIFETALMEFFHNASVRDGVVVSTIQGKPVAILEEMFASTFQLPLEGLSDLHEVPQDLVIEARVSFRTMVGSFDAVTHERFLMMTAIHGGINWSKILFKVLKDMVTPGSKQVRGFAVQICIVLKGTPDLELGESKEFPPLKILTANNIGKYIAINKNIAIEDVEDEPVMEKQAEKKKTVLAGIEHSIDVNDEDDNLDGAENEIARKMASFTAPKQFLKEPLRSGEDDDISGVEQPITVEGPTRIKFGLGIQILGVSEVDPYTAKVVSGPLSSIADLASVKDIIVKEKQFLTWAETDSLETAVRRQEYIIAKYREMLLRKFLEAHRQNFKAGQPMTAIDLRIIELLSNAHIFAFETLQAQMRLHGVKWDRICGSRLFEGDSLYRGLFINVRKEVQLQKTALSLDILESQQKLQSQQVACSQAYDDKLKKIEDRQDALSHKIMEFRVQAQENYNHLMSQLSELVDYINRGRDDKKGESGSSRGPQPPGDRGRPGSGDGGNRSRGGSRTEPPRKRGGGGSQRRDWRYWI
ncbi:splicing factor 3B subunit 1-like [Dorcoceras hygrometricum]|uniref:Splicing factor 3B subunit 1-like n=1 Tax=Dorcoceras hygrometricum TaxID=472368 RepID=A0A2Z7DAS1_9LAMI|nr:splicing factor 3B subunit 1-like [Dorcoceras hygrometricum]